MGYVKEQMLKDEYNEDLKAFLEKLLEQDELNGALQGIAKQVIAKGVNSMSDKQKLAIDSFVENYTNSYECEMCSNGNVSALTDYIKISEEGICPMCEYDKEKYMSE